MKNIHVLPTDKPSRLISSGKEFTLFKKPLIDKRCKNIYITSDEVTLSNNGDYYLGYPDYNAIHKWRMEGMHEEKQVWINKIILTDDPDLIKDGVQAIDDEFLEWFVKNPSCESVEVSYEVLKPFQSIDKGYILRLPDNEVLEEQKQETLEEAAEYYFQELLKAKTVQPHEQAWIKAMFVWIAKWQAERIYSEKEVYDLLKKSHEDRWLKHSNNSLSKNKKHFSVNKWFERFKKK